MRPTTRALTVALLLALTPLGCGRKPEAGTPATSATSAPKTAPEAGPAAKAEEPASRPAAEGMAAHATKKSEADLGPIKVEKASGAEGKTIAELYAARTALKDKPVAVRGKVVKYLPEIMGKNWVHVKDGTGSKAGKDDDLTFTTKEKVEIGSVIVVRGTLKIDHDPGTGFVYPVLLEDPKITK